MDEQELRSEIERLSEVSKNDNSQHADDLRGAANALAKLTHFGDPDVLKAFRFARMVTDKQSTKLTVSTTPIADFVTVDTGEFSRIISSVRAKIFEVKNSGAEARVIAYVTLLTVKVKSPYDIDFARRFHNRVKLHHSIFSGFDTSRYIKAGADVLSRYPDQSLENLFRVAIVNPAATSVISVNKDSPVDEHEGTFIQGIREAIESPDVYLLHEILAMADLSGEESQEPEE